ncbi:hypothetical protein Thewi_2160 [Thermoanaerobacter wiegelii Rt8.B1]|uniref:Uncharacterized protein n=2 Tax=Thermoanaerobacter TaxID=1754 RepID=G2MTX4_9THEO|nr:hypothetical protein Thewi_2160 [Thermoanaerobacter wiegelii Rt8.B1]
MRKQKQFWTVVSERTFQRLRELSEETGMTITKVVLWILFEQFDYSTEIRNDYTFTTAKGHKIVAKVTDEELERLQDLAQKHSMSVSRLVRNILYTHFFKKSE